MSLCPWPACATETQGVFCADHYFRIAPARARMIQRMKIACRRAESEDTRAHLTDQLTSYINAAVRDAEGHHAA